MSLNYMVLTQLSLVVTDLNFLAGNLVLRQYAVVQKTEGYCSLSSLGFCLKGNKRAIEYKEITAQRICRIPISFIQLTQVQILSIL